ncbi:IclR family transcriptional regulator [Natrinema thermotolerans]|uniref:IclR family transcriptional regulator n=1 Tax=Natrinema thermotolerans TaxID=121872 RepID=UPI000678F5F0|nr:IclR family transcriptional regulator [Natrinema thermotolerans]
MDADDSSDSPRRIKSIQTASAILEAIQHLEAPTFTDLCGEVDISKGTVHTYLETLESEGFITKSGNEYRLGVRLVTMGESVRNQTDIYRAGQDEVEKLAEKTGEWVHLTVECQGQEVTLYESSGDRAIAMDYHLRMRESPQYLYHTAAGKAMLACFDRDRVRKLINRQGFVQRTEKTITDLETLFEELDRIQTQGYAVNDEEEVRGMRSVGTAITGPDAGVCGAISVTAPTSRLSGEYFESEIPELVMEAANIIEVNLETAGVKQPR